MFPITDDQKALVDAVRDFTEQRVAPHALDWDAEKHFPVDVLAEAGELGLGGIYVGEEHGGTGLERTDAILIFEELAKADPAFAAYISIHNMVAWMIDSFGTDEQRARWIPDLASMEHLASYCLTEPGAGSDAAALKTRAVRDGDHYVLNGVKQFISGAGASDCYVVMCRTADTGARGISAVVVHKDTPGLSFGPNEKKMGWHTQPTRQVIFEDVRVPVADRLGEEGDGFRIAMKGLNGGRLNIGACSIGGGLAALDKATRYLKERSAFGEPLTTKQALVFELADMSVKLETAHTMLMRAADALDRNDPDTVRLCAMAKLVATESGYEAADTALQLHGGYGYLHEYGVEKLVRDLRVHRILEGSNEIMRMIVGRGLIG
ncbi:MULTISPECIES: acyl-CoA dehydrogenase family protein [Micrococcus]|uniref:acyl-CoA dehydrogenase family protein n=1 Tax=Micrococcus TaxID=1269 RepID=UPI00106DD067|nr:MULTISPECIES: acyl-CoA dehydrogenase family protein [Micrococcus]MCK6058080.1 acyl-CoA dehydrogenase family protein [Micrococcus luteus]MCK6062331.1 acyl-CoA dehydrogenase family protein [Micrococcus luteus]MCK6064626.1 acyl-CoA dehydrogenase family protein [Micrococcus luteus]MCK6193091.1 acyl-CoA dehydrogenase family protein [Micrococcus luteus]MCK6195271.1 acyl-CoA dehydrogenase family protein [Micrococcus luteus]